MGLEERRLIRFVLGETLLAVITAGQVREQVAVSDTQDQGRSQASERLKRDRYSLLLYSRSIY
jgi:hypothetical protein